MSPNFALFIAGLIDYALAFIAYSISAVCLGFALWLILEVLWPGDDKRP